MPKKFYDIIPPKQKKSFNSVFDKPKRKPMRILESRIRIKKEESAAEKIKKNKRIKTELSETVVKSPKRIGVIFKKEKKAKKFFKFKKVLIFLLFFLILVTIQGLFLFSKTEIEIWPETRVLTLKNTITVDLNYSENDFENKIIPAKLFNDQKSISREFSASGTVLKKEKAAGLITVYNDYSTADQPLLVNTRFVSEDGKLFRSVQREIIKGGRYEGGKFIPGETTIEVRAAEPGEDYNIEASAFSIPGFAGTDKYTSFYGRSFSPMKGGFKGKVSQITQDDLDSAKEFLSRQAKKESRDFLRTALPQGFILLDEAVDQQIIEESFSAEAEETADYFTGNVKVVSTALIFKESDIEKFAENLISLKAIENEKIQENSLEISYSPDSLTLEEGKMVLNLEITAMVFQNIDLEKLKQALLGKSLQEANIFLEDQEEIVRTKINIGGFWKKRIPKNVDKVEIKMNLQ